MKADRQLLELAAKAVGLTTTHKWNAERLELSPPVLALVVRRNGELVSTGWNPRDDDGDSRWLQVKLRMTVQTTDKEATAYCDELPDGTNWITVQITDDMDDMAATRLAVLRAAAAIGEAMP